MHTATHQQTGTQPLAQPSGNTGNATGWRLFLRTMIARAYPRVIGQQREKAWIFFETLLPFLATVGYVYVYRAMRAPEEYIGFAVVGGAMTAFWLNVIWSMATQMYWEKENGNLPLFILSPAPLMAILLGMALGGMVATMLRAVIVLTLGSWLFGVVFTVHSFAQLLAVFALTMAALYGLGMLFASLFLLFGRDAWQIAQMLQEPVYFISGFYFPVKTFGLALGLIASLLPLTLGMDAMRQLIFRNGPALGLLPVPIEIGALLALAVINITAARFWLGYIERQAIQHGSLTDRRK